MVVWLTPVATGKPRLIYTNFGPVFWFNIIFHQFVISREKLPRSELFVITFEYTRVV